MCLVSGFEKYVSGAFPTVDTPVNTWLGSKLIHHMLTKELCLFGMVRDWLTEKRMARVGLNFGLQRGKKGTERCSVSKTESGD